MCKNYIFYSFQSSYPNVLGLGKTSLKWLNFLSLKIFKYPVKVSLACDSLVFVDEFVAF